MNAEGLKRTPHRDVEDLSIVYRLLFDRDDGGIASAKISDTMQQAWGVSEQDLFDAASKNTKELLPTKILPLGQMLENLMGVNPIFRIKIFLVKPLKVLAFRGFAFLMKSG